MKAMGLEATLVTRIVSEPMDPEELHAVGLHVP